MKPKILIIGAGFAGSTFARLAAEDGLCVDIIEKRNHLGGNSYSYQDGETGVEIHKYGPHIFHTNHEGVFHFISRFARLNSYTHKVKAISHGRVYSLPINLHTINQFFCKILSPAEAIDFIEKKRVRFDTILNFEEYVLNSIGRELYDAFYQSYTLKQWGKDPSQIPVSTAQRLPIRYNYDDNYFSDRYQGIPEQGYGALFAKLLNHENIKVYLDCNYHDVKASWRKDYAGLIFSGPIDEYFDYRYGKLPYRTIAFEKLISPEIQGTSVINHCDDSCDFTRIHEHKYFTPGKKCSMSVGFKEYSKEADDNSYPYYPVECDSSMEMMTRYRALANEETDVMFIGRLGNFKYFNMDQSIENAMHVYSMNRQRWLD